MLRGRANGRREEEEEGKDKGQKGEAEVAGGDEEA
jgi:hypothetical protein